MGNAKIPEITINTFEELKKYIEDNELIKTKRSYIPDDINIITNPVDLGFRFFRGMKNSNYKLSSTLERYIYEYYEFNFSKKGIDLPKKEFKLSKKDFENISREFLHKCKETLKSKIPEKYILLNEEFEDEIWFYGQHYELSTPFLDWSRSFLIALYFAFEDYKNDTDYRVVYILRTLMMDDYIKIYEPKIDLGGRLTSQKGVFTKMLSEDLENINSKDTALEYIDKHKCLSKVLINTRLRNDILEYLWSLNIDSSTIYPDIKGAIKSSHLELGNILETRILE